MTTDAVQYPPLLCLEWVDATNIAQWQPLAEVPEWAVDGGFVCRSIGYLVHEDSECVVLAARIAMDAEPQQAGLVERIPAGTITDRWQLTMPKRSQRA